MYPPSGDTAAGGGVVSVNMFGLLSVPWDFFHIGLLIVVIMILITGMVICVSVIGVCCFHWLESLERNREDQHDPSTCDNPDCQQQQSNVHVVVLPEKGKPGERMDPCQLREHFQRVDTELSVRRFLYDQRQNRSLSATAPPSSGMMMMMESGPPPSYEMLYPYPPLTSAEQPPKNK